MEKIALTGTLMALMAFAGDNFPPAGPLIERAIAVRDAQDAKGWKFTYREDEERRDAKDNPRTPFLRTYDVIMLEGENYRKLILFDGQPIDAKTAKSVEAELEKTREERKKHRFLHKSVALGGIRDLERLCDNKVVGEETIGGRKAWRVESDAKPGGKAANPAEEELLATHRITWFDEEEGIDIRRETTYTRTVNKIQAGTHGEIEWSKVGDAWLPAMNYFKGDVKFFPGIQAAGNYRQRYYDYKRFSADSTFTPN